jgi:hypothetical protein
MVAAEIRGAAAAEVAVVDRGIGISAAVQEQLFTAHAGAIGVTRRPHLGSRF